MLKANEQCWRKSRHAKTAIIRSVPDEATRLPMLKRGEADVSSAAFGNAANRPMYLSRQAGCSRTGRTPTSRGSSASKLDRGKREAVLHRIQQLLHDKAMFAPIFELASLGGYGPWVAESGLGLIPSMAASAPYEDLKLEGK